MNSVILPSLACVATPAVIVTALALVLGTSGMDGPLHSMLLMTLLLTSLHFLFLSLPALLIIRWLSRLTLIPVLTVGFLSSTIPSAFKFWPIKDPYYSGIGRSRFFGEAVVTSVDGIPTIWGWIIYAQKLAMIGALFGVTSALVFWFFYRKVHKSSH
ncbi:MULTISPECIES: hypothetical protein [Marinobacter]|uniref:hypothetical protein n=2 Tax=Marinobacteraceae TaxID=2887365 RepID=UPI002943B0B1|nr:hypothetical protein [Marinobacter salarius]WOI20163.1 hypothetical protein R1T46_04640 [Marinobacter salarius]